MANYLVTGASGGMGSAIIRRLVREGHSVWGIDRVEPSQVLGWHFICADITRSDDLQETFDIVRAETRYLNGIIHAAGVYDLDSLVEMPEDNFLHDFDVNLFGMFRINKMFLPLLSAGARIVIISSELAPLHPLPFTSVYAITKAAVDRYASALRMELQLLGLHVITVRPGAVKTAMLSDSTEKLDKFCDTTRLYSFGAARFKKIVHMVESRHVSPEKVSKIILQALEAPKPRLTYNINRNPLLLLYQLLPTRLKLSLIKKILEE